ncbi:glycosyl hydrolase family 18 protein [Paenibacillus macerans]|uniref:glycosyl hydrolase family 18 protein n=1 Tax=Paenibacillus macerans TaxID=44252 RepID=UPI00242CD76B|nr:glycosyl hydrolase family 18 protein [Paenibacillus macerans]MED4953529.1 glycosyl hydrolase family 18 protein [Paenibacillus macerans]
MFKSLFIRKSSLFIVAVAMIVIVCGGIYYIYINRAEGRVNAIQEKVSRPTDLSAWIVDWQLDSGEEDYGAAGSRLSELQMFAAYFDASGHLYLADTFRDSLANDASLRQADGGLFLTIVNDLRSEDGSVVQKDSDLTKRLTQSGEARREHIREILNLVDQLDLDGVEIDYEKIKDGDWNGVVAFYNELYQELLQDGRKLRVVLEPGAPLKRLKLPKGPEYVVMAYNLYGSHSGPGPKADKKFIKELVGKMASIPGNKRLALATGGFAWNEKGEVAAVTEKEADGLSELSKDGVERDKVSGSLHFKYTDADGGETTVWYADGVTLRSWIVTAREAGCHRIAIWRLGGLSQRTLKMLAEID